MSGLNLNHLRVFAAVAATGGVRRSSDVLHRTSGAVTRAVAVLEACLGTRLFERKGRGMRLTAAGEAVWLRTRTIEAALQEVHGDAVRLGARDGHAVTAIGVLFNERRLRIAALLADIHHMPGVAQALGMSLSGANRALARLEEDLGQRLFRHTAHGMLPSDAGGRWILHFNRVLAELEHIHADVAALDGMLEGVVTVGALPLARTRVLPVAVAALLRKHPRLTVRSLESTYEELTAGVQSGRVDVIIAATRQSSGQGLAAIPLMQDRPAVVARAGHPLARKGALSFDDLAPYGWVLPRAGTPLVVLLEEFHREHGRTLPEPMVETGDLALLRGLLLSSDMLGLLSPHQVHYEVEAGELVVLPLAMASPERQIGVITRASARLSPGARALIEELTRAASATVSGAPGGV